ncbi:outer arm dynein light chain 1 [Gonapodya prolifera JEL478]|uniref:Outer arm dynein light chain 1 n=1 Tax=Gonapodya prolifera (strain JEL478) TaxID=1344416 RepID=A0A139A834_GONPJ|nr:outer arm dynein light chain 1 [Gonapodya prolifera JEL478]|eukprot:KXS12859.1 outer arm dynein light chain 1 [Gonapodya prolifera JEL478]
MRITIDDVAARHPSADLATLDALSFRAHDPPLTAVGDLSGMANLHKVDLSGNRLLSERSDGSTLEGLRKCALVTLLNLAGNAGEKEPEGGAGSAGGGVVTKKTLKENKKRKEPTGADASASCPPSSGVLAGMAGLLVLNMSSCNVTLLTPSLSNFTHLRALILSHNNLSLSSLDPRAFANLAHLNTLVLSHNRLGPVIPANVLQPLVALEKLSLSHCGLKEFPDLSLLTESALKAQADVKPDEKALTEETTGDEFTAEWNSTSTERLSAEVELPAQRNTLAQERHPTRPGRPTKPSKPTSAAAASESTPPPPARPAPLLRELRLSDNDIATVPQDATTWCASLEILDMGGNPVESVAALQPLASSPIHNLTLHRTPFALLSDYKSLVSASFPLLRVLDNARIDPRFEARKRKREAMEKRRDGKKKRRTRDGRGEGENEGESDSDAQMGSGPDDAEEEEERTPASSSGLFRGVGPRPLPVLQREIGKLDRHAGGVKRTRGEDGEDKDPSKSKAKRKQDDVPRGGAESERSGVVPKKRRKEERERGGGDAVTAGKRGDFGAQGKHKAGKSASAGPAENAVSVEGPLKTAGKQGLSTSKPSSHEPVKPAKPTKPGNAQNPTGPSATAAPSPSAAPPAANSRPQPRDDPSPFAAVLAKQASKRATEDENTGRESGVVAVIEVGGKGAGAVGKEKGKKGEEKSGTGQGVGVGVEKKEVKVAELDLEKAFAGDDVFGDGLVVGGWD